VLEETLDHEILLIYSMVESIKKKTLYKAMVKTKENVFLFLKCSVLPLRILTILRKTYFAGIFFVLKKGISPLTFF